MKFMKLSMEIALVITGIVIGLQSGPQIARASHMQSVFPAYSRHTWYEYIPGHGYERIHFYRRTIIRTSKHHRSYEYVTTKGFNNIREPYKAVFVSGHKFTAPTGRSPHAMASMIPGYWVVKHVTVYGKRRIALASAVGAGFNINNTYAFRKKVPWQVSWMYNA
ncbi:hypothetical protein LASUN_10540 [Lentilactobacillus sunkii]|jgi:hypothetical protein|uniref:Uncharacterized protein n=1 Tax=Lentilactobacillus sunkii TaxID=481719 RepID=A0A1E7XE98_9LACO|nr:hypothetical protein [Lentilactobacillus sunkii]OFA11445.1 hypothetical protein LASUN_10540 [Lentilactobacillus sunkii]